jgi:hypothetical protein
VPEAGSVLGDADLELVERKMTAVPPRPKTPSRAKTPLRLGVSTPRKSANIGTGTGVKI